MPDPLQGTAEMAARELQRLADASEDDSTTRYVRQQRLAVVVAEACRRAEAMMRLEASLHVLPAPRPAA
ncbi:MAG: hypothetical protein ACYDAC_01050 [Candidatus Dormibacteria bacterium]